MVEWVDACSLSASCENEQNMSPKPMLELADAVIRERERVHYVHYL